MAQASGPERTRVPASSVFVAFLKLGLTSFGGPVAHLGYFRRDLVDRRGWLTPQAFDELVALCQLLPGPTSSQVGFAIGLRMAGATGALTAFAGFTLPSATLMIAAAYGLAAIDPALLNPAIHGLKLVAASIVALAVLTMARQHLRSVERIALALATLIVVFALPYAQTAPAAIGLTALLGLARAPGAPTAQRESTVRGSLTATTLLLAAVALLLAGPSIASLVWPSRTLDIFGAFARSGALVFGGGHVVLPLLQAETAQLVSPDAFLAGYGFAQALPGPLFSFAGYLGALAGPAPPDLGTALLTLAAIFLPGLLLVAAADPWWSRLAASTRARSVGAFASAAVVGVLAAACWSPVATSAIRTPPDALLVAAGLIALLSGRIPVLAVVATMALAGAALA